MFDRRYLPDRVFGIAYGVGFASDLVIEGAEGLFNVEGRALQSVGLEIIPFAYVSREANDVELKALRERRFVQGRLISEAGE